MTNFIESKVAEASKSFEEVDTESDMEDTKRKTEIKRHTKDERKIEIKRHTKDEKPKPKTKKPTKKDLSDSEESETELKKPKTEEKKVKKEDSTESTKKDSDSESKTKRKRSSVEAPITPRAKKPKLNTNFLQEEPNFEKVLEHGFPLVTLFKVLDEHCEYIASNMKDATHHLTLVDANIQKEGFSALKEKFKQITKLEMIACEVNDVNLNDMFTNLPLLHELNLSNPIGLNGKIIANYVARSSRLTTITLINLPIANVSDIFDGLALNRTVKTIDVHTGEGNLAEKVRLLKLHNPKLVVNWINHSNNKQTA